MKYIVETDRSQINLFPVSLDQSIEHDNEVQLIDLFVNSLPLGEYGFKVSLGENGRPRYRLGVLLKLFIYEYFLRTNSFNRSKVGLSLSQSKFSLRNSIAFSNVSKLFKS